MWGATWARGLGGEVLKNTEFSAAPLKVRRVYMIFILIASLTPVLREGAWRFKRSLLHSSESGGVGGWKNEPGKSSPSLGKNGVFLGKPLPHRGDGAAAGGGSVVLGQIRTLLLLIRNPGGCKGRPGSCLPLFVVSSKSQDNVTKEKGTFLHVVWLIS